MTTKGREEPAYNAGTVLAIIVAVAAVAAAWGDLRVQMAHVEDKLDKHGEQIAGIYRRLHIEPTGHATADDGGVVAHVAAP